MLNNRNVQILFLVLLAVMVLLDWNVGFSWYWYILLLSLYLGLTVYGSSVIQANYFVRSVCRGNTNVKSIAITFDDGPSAANTDKVLNILREQKAPAAFFLIGKNIAGNEALLKRMMDEGHIIGNHSYSHNFWFSMKSTTNMLLDMKRCDEEIKRVIGKQVNLFRPPYGVTNPMVSKSIKLGAYTSVGWSLRTFDTSADNKEKLLRKTLTKLKNGDVVLFHDSGIHTVPILNEFLDSVRSKGFEIVALDELLGVKAYI